MTGRVGVRPVSSWVSAWGLALLLLLVSAALMSCGGVSSSSGGSGGNNTGGTPPGGGGTGGSGGGSGGTGGGTGGSGGSGGSGGGTPAPATGTYVYVVDLSPNVIETFKVDVTSGALTSAGAPLALGHTLNNLSITPNGKFAYGMANDLTGNEFGNFLLSFTFDTNTGLPTLKDTLQLGTGIGGSTAVDPSGKFLYVSVDSNNSTGSGIAVFNVQADGTLSRNGGVVPTDPNPGHLAIDPKGRFLYVDTASTNKEWGFAINSTTGSLSPVPNTPFTIQRQLPVAGKEPVNLNSLVDPAGQRLFVVDNINARVNVFTIDQGNGGITLQGVTTLTQFVELFAPAMDPKGRFLYVGAFNDDTITGFSIASTATPQFNVLPGMPAHTSGAPNWWMVVDASANFLYSVQNGGVGDIGNIDGYRIDQNTGGLTRLASTPVKTAGSPFWIAITTR